MKKTILLLFLSSVLSLGVYAQSPANGDLILDAKNKIYRYYGKESFEEPEWIRVKNFLNWLDENEISLNKRFREAYPGTNTENSEKLFFAFLGANYVSQKLINKKFDLPIQISREGCYADQVHICIEPYNYMEVLNVAIHEAAHILPAIINKDIQPYDILSEEITTFAQLKYALPLKSGKIVHGTKAFFIYSDKETNRLKINDIKGEYADIVYSAVNYSDFNESTILNKKIRKSRSVYKILQIIFNGIDNNYLGKNYILNDDEIYYLQNPVFQDTKKDMENSLSPKVLGYNYSKGYLQKIFLDNEEEILSSFVKNLRKHADKNIPPVPKGYI